MPRFSFRNAQINVDLAGQGRPLVLLHGFMGSAASWQVLRASLNAHYQTVAIDLLGHGASESPEAVERYAMGQCVEDVLEVLDALQIERALMLGYSMGGRVALSVAAHAPHRLQALMLESASPGLATEAEREARRKSDFALADSLERGGLPAFVTRWEALPLFASQTRLPEATRASVRAQRLQNNPLGLANSLRGLGTGAQPSLWEALPNIPLPVLLLTGELDVKFTTIARDMALRLPQAVHRILSQAGHTVHLEQPDQFLKQLLVFASSFNPQST